MKGEQRFVWVVERRFSDTGWEVAGFVGRTKLDGKKELGVLRKRYPHAEWRISRFDRRRWIP